MSFSQAHFWLEAEIPYVQHSKNRSQAFNTLWTHLLWTTSWRMGQSTGHQASSKGKMQSLPVVILELVDLLLCFCEW
jgi:hypothetical protein